MLQRIQRLHLAEHLHLVLQLHWVQTLVRKLKQQVLQQQVVQQQLLHLMVIVLFSCLCSGLQLYC